MAGIGTFLKCRKQIEGGIKRQTKLGRNYVALDLPYFTSDDQKLTDNYIKELESRGLRVQIHHTDSSRYGKAYW